MADLAFVYFKQTPQLKTKTHIEGCMNNPKFSSGPAQPAIAGCKHRNSTMTYRLQRPFPVMRKR